MIKHVYSLRDKKLGFYNDIAVDMIAPAEFLDLQIRRVQMSDTSIQIKYRDFALYYLGTYDDVSGKFDLKSDYEKLFDFEDCIKVKSEEVTNEN